MKRFLERMGGKVDRAAGVIRGVKLLGRKSRNGRTYSDTAMREAAPKYNGKKVYLDHPDREAVGADRKFRDWVGVVENAEYRRGAIYADVRMRQQSEHYEALIEAAESFDGFFGMSHVADGESRHDRDTGEEIIEAINEVFSVDIVTEPATAAGLFEGQDIHFDSLGDAIVKVPGEEKPAKWPRAEVDAADLDDEPSESAGIDLQPVRALLAKHGKVLAAVCGSDAIDELAAIAGKAKADEAEPVQESRRPWWAREERTEENLNRFADSLRGEPSFDFSKPGAFARRYR